MANSSPESNKANGDWAKLVSEQMTGFQQQIERLSQDTIPAVARQLGESVRKNVIESPYQTLAKAFCVGLGLTALSGAHVKRAAARIGKLAAFRALAEGDKRKQGGTENGNAKQATGV